MPEYLGLLHKSSVVNFDDFCFLFVQLDSESYIFPGLFPGCIRSIFNSPFYQPKARQRQSNESLTLYIPMWAVMAPLAITL